MKARLSGWTLRRRLLASTVALMAAVCLVVGVVSVLALKAFLEQKVDDQLTFAVKRSQNFQGSRPPQSGTQPVPQIPADQRRAVLGFLQAPGQSEGTLGLSINSTGTRSGYLDPDGAIQSLSSRQQALVRAVPDDREPHTVHLGGDLGTYRVVGSRTPSGDVIKTGLPLSAARDAALQLAGVVLSVTVAGLLLAALIGTVVVRFALRPLERIAGTATAVSALQLDRGEVALAVRVPADDTDPRTEVGQVGAALNRMLGHVASALTARHASEARVRQFVADASHELRTPLAAIRGYAELTRRSGQEVPPDVAHALGRVESEARRMTALVEDLLLLARLDEGRPTEMEPVDLSRLVVDAVSDAHAAGPGHRWQLDLPDAAVEVTGDEARLHQVIANLLANARVHTPSGTTVQVGLAADPGGTAVLTVVDDGPGIPAGLQPEVFERFARGDASRSRVQGSTGLGLAIVAAVVAAHGGRIDVRSVPGRTEFRVELPSGADRGVSEVSSEDSRPEQQEQRGFAKLDGGRERS